MAGTTWNPIAKWRVFTHDDRTATRVQPIPHVNEQHGVETDHLRRSLWHDERVLIFGI